MRPYERIRSLVAYLYRDPLEGKPERLKGTDTPIRLMTCIFRVTAM